MCLYTNNLNSILEHINSPKDLKSLHQKDLGQLAIELRKFIIDIVSVKEGHLGASLGVVELTIALHYVFNTPVDKFGGGNGHYRTGRLGSPVDLPHPCPEPGDLKPSITCSIGISALVFCA